VLVSLPWILGGLAPDRGDLTWSILIAFGAGFLGIGAMVLTAFDVAEARLSAIPDQVPDRKDGTEALEEAAQPTGSAAKARRRRRSSASASSREAGP
jgi:hypothetical protein